MTHKNMVETHRIIISKLREMAEEDEYRNVEIARLVNILGMDLRTIRRHLIVAEMDGVGRFAPEDNPIYFTVM